MRIKENPNDVVLKISSHGKGRNNVFDSML